MKKVSFIIICFIFVFGHPLLGQKRKLKSKETKRTKKEIIYSSPEKKNTIQNPKRTNSFKKVQKKYSGTLTTDLSGTIYIKDEKYDIKARTPLIISIEERDKIIFETKDNLMRKDISFKYDNSKQIREGFDIKASLADEYAGLKQEKNKEDYVEMVLNNLSQNFVPVGAAEFRYEGRQRSMRPFEISITEVTKEQFRLFKMDQKQTDKAVAIVIDRYGLKERRPSTNPLIDWSYDVEGQISDTNGDLEYPVSFVSWEEAVEFCNWLSKIDKAYTYRLPYSYEWDYVASDGFKNEYPWQHIDFPDEVRLYANLGDISRDRLFGRHLESSNKACPWDDEYGFKSPVASFLPNAMGVHDLGGNVAEWLLDDARRNGNDYKLIRGGSFFTNIDACRIIADRPAQFRSKKLDRHNAIGFRLVREKKSVVD